MSTNRPRIKGDAGTDVFRQTAEPAAGAYAMNPADDVVMGGAGGAQVVTLPPTARVREGDSTRIIAAFGSVTLTANAGQTVGGAATQAIALGNALDVTFDGVSNWIITGVAGGGGPPIGPAGGDLGGTYPNPKVVGLQTVPISAAAPAAGNVLTFNAGVWAPAAPAGGALAGDVNGALGANHVDAFHGPGAGAPLAGFVNIVFDKGQLTPTITQGARTDASAGQDFILESQGAAVGNGAAGGQLQVNLGYSDSVLNGARKILFQQDQVPGGGALTSLAFIDNVGRMQIAGGPTSASTTIGASNASTAFGGISFGVPAPANVTSSNYTLGGNQVDAILNAPNQTIVATAAIRFRLLGNFDGDYLRLTYESSGNGKFAFQSNAGTGGNWIDWRMPGAPAITSFNEHYTDQGGGAQTTDATVTVIRAVPVPADSFGNGSTIVLETLIIMQAETAPAGGLAGDVAAYKTSATFKNKGGLITQVGAMNTIWSDVDGSMAATAVSYAISGTNINIRVTGLAGTTILHQLHPAEITLK